MEQQTEQGLFDIQIDDVAANHLIESAKWSKFLAIVWFVLCGLMVIAAFFAGSVIASAYSTVSPGLAQSGFGGAFFTFIYLVIAAIQLVPNIFRYKYAVKSLKALRTNDQYTLNESFNNLRLLNKYWGILTIIVIAIYVLAFVFGIMGALMRF